MELGLDCGNEKKKRNPENICSKNELNIVTGQIVKNSNKEDIIATNS